MGHLRSAASRSDGWDDNPRQSDNVGILISQVEDGTFDFTW
jgi:hypothetical protein